MDRRYRRGFSTAEKTEMWDRWQRGESMRSIGRVFGKPSSSIYFQLSPLGGIRPRPRRRSRLALTLSEREEISRGIVAERSIRAMARLLGRPASTVSREVRRNGGYDRYRAAQADAEAWVRCRRHVGCNSRRRNHTGRRNCGCGIVGYQTPGTRNRRHRKSHNSIGAKLNPLSKQIGRLCGYAAMRLCLERICPPRKDQPVLIDLPEMTTSKGVSRVMAGILEAVADGEITPDEATLPAQAALL
ncbi:MAG: helix-turn-helix domain-containing protein [Rhodospirillales bacterium]|nr:helix-turn-helix domain-containing protein [Rhodospirillales bacterium]